MAVVFGLVFIQAKAKGATIAGGYLINGSKNGKNGVSHL